METMRICDVPTTVIYAVPGSVPASTIQSDPTPGPTLFLVCKHSPTIPSYLWVPLNVWVCVTVSAWTMRLCHNLSLDPGSVSLSLSGP